MPDETAGPVEIIVTDAELLHDLLDEAEEALRVAAMINGAAGILVTRHDPGRYTVALSETVPLGETREQSCF